MVTSEDLRGAVEHEVGAVLERTQEHRAEDGVVDHDPGAGAMGGGDRCVEIREG